ncbi:uncharacterized protein FA14DRAFT_181444 [Meira miltonrushii]|uniref:Secreted protein n=1 Tax=Meira miltonrushii TaxID=1280837 RepID=A0A316VB37_9BASI|nr:uncharacterized protein FA14DRAFT_181444 [Meira miltonrushii]PWN32765.1 hypothetical protein FA14DRAFT_181444 [Meira miltonrushii]
MNFFSLKIIPMFAMALLIMVQMTLQAPVPTGSLSVDGSTVPNTKNGAITTQSSIVRIQNTNGTAVGSHGRNAAISSVGVCPTCKRNPCRCNE